MQRTFIKLPLATKRHAKRQCDGTVPETRFPQLMHIRASVLQATRRPLPDDDPEPAAGHARLRCLFALGYLTPALIHVAAKVPLRVWAGVE